MSVWVSNARMISLMPLYEYNYDQLMAMLPDLRRQGRAGAALRNGTHVRVTVLERCKYTTTVSLTHRFPKRGRYLTDMRLKVRLYHDAQVAETLGYQHLGRIKPRYPLPNPHMLHRDEKRQINQLLRDFLGYCLRQQARFDDLDCANA
ncbi:DUF1249 domain-containing protein [Ectothiorhodospiraceae bacterium 2226]|nr:DUF1249 domain-containing protein [Ectothiorhodospiraceae bacterium 2226]